MVVRPVRRALTLAVVGVLAIAGTAAADNLRADGDLVSAGAQTFVDLGEVLPGAILTVPVAFELTCTSTTHPDPGQSITLTLGPRSAPNNGLVVSATTAVIGPVPAGWAADGTTCDSPSPTFTNAATSTVTLRAPTVINVGYVYTIGWTRTISPAGIDDAHALSGTASSVSFTLAVVANTAPVLTVPADQTVEGDTTGGWTAVYPGVSATDAEDTPDPSPTCSPAAGEVLPLGTTTVACSVTDSGGRTADDTFDVTVVDTTAPSLTTDTDHGVTTDDPAGATLAYDPASATDIVDAAPTVGCLPAAGTAIPVGTTTVTCTATDDSGNSTTGTFDVSVDYVPANTAPVLTVPADQTVEGDTTGGWTAVYPGVSATDAEDTPDPSPTCSPAAGEVLPLGTTTVACSVTDSGGRTADDTFDVTVVDTTAPSLTTDTDHGVTTDDPAGATLAYDPASATDIVDAAPTVGCLPAAGTAIPVGTTTVTCTATDDSGNSTTGTFDVSVDYVGGPSAAATWLEPVGSGSDSFDANRGRTVPVKVILSVNGKVRTTGPAALHVTPCSGGDPVVLALTYGGGRWNASLDTSDLAGSCHRVTARIAGLVAGTVTLQLHGAETAAKTKAPKAR